MTRRQRKAFIADQKDRSRKRATKPQADAFTAWKERAADHAKDDEVLGLSDILADDDPYDIADAMTAAFAKGQSPEAFVEETFAEDIASTRGRATMTTTNRPWVCGSCHAPLDLDEQKQLVLVFEACRDDYEKRLRPGSISVQAACIAHSTCPRCVLRATLAVYADRMARPRGPAAVRAAQRALREAEADQHSRTSESKA